MNQHHDAIDRRPVTVTFAPIGNDGPGTIQRLQLLLKAAFRGYGLRAVSIAPPPSPANAVTPQPPLPHRPAPQKPVQGHRRVVQRSHMGSIPACPATGPRHGRAVQHRHSPTSSNQRQPRTPSGPTN